MRASRRAGTISVDKYGMSGMPALADAWDSVESDSLPDLFGRESHSLNSGAGAGGTVGAGEVVGAGGAGVRDAGLRDAGLRDAGRRRSAAGAMSSPGRPRRAPMT